MKCHNNFEIKVFKYGNKYRVGARSQYGPFCNISPDFSSIEDAENYVKELNFKSDNVICDLCNKDSLCK